jgi:hypothetical protein
MLLRATRVFLSGVFIAGWLAVPSTAQQSPSPSPAQPPCDAFTKNADGDWVAKQDMTLPGPTGPVQIKAGTPVDDDMQDELDDRCK